MHAPRISPGCVPAFRPSAEGKFGGVENPSGHYIVISFCPGGYWFKWKIYGNRENSWELAPQDPQILPFGPEAADVPEKAIKTSLVPEIGRNFHPGYIPQLPFFIVSQLRPFFSAR